MGWSWRPVAGAVTGLSHQTDLPSIVRARLRRTGGAQGVLSRTTGRPFARPVAPAPGAWPFSMVDPASSFVARKAENCSLPVVLRAPLSVDAGQRTWIQSPATLRHTTAGSS
jgi:hypothetical protein